MATTQSNVLHEFEIVQTLGIDAGHRVYKHNGKCANLHGHRYTFEIYARPLDGLDGLGMVTDFSVIKERINAWLLEHWDHGMILSHDDDLAPWFKFRTVKAKSISGANTFEVQSPLHGQKFFELPYSVTAENLCSYLLNVAKQLMEGTGVDVFKVGVYETPNGYARARLE